MVKSILPVGRRRRLGRLCASVMATGLLAVAGDAAPALAQTSTSDLPPTNPCPAGPVPPPPPPPAIPGGPDHGHHPPRGPHGRGRHLRGHVRVRHVAGDPQGDGSSLPPRVYVVDNHIPPGSPAGTPYLVDVIDPATNTITHSIPVLPEPHHIYVVPGQDEAYVSHFGGCQLDVVNLLTDQVIGYVHTRFGPRHMAFSPDGRYAYVIDFYDEHLTIVDTTTNQTVAEVPTGPYPNYPAPTPDGRLVFVANLGSDTVTVINARPPFNVVKTIIVGNRPFNLVPTPNGRLMLVANSGDDTVSFIDTRTLQVVATVPFRAPGEVTNVSASQKTNIRVSADGRYAWVGDENGSAWGVIDIAQQRLYTFIPAAAGSDILFSPMGGPAQGLGIGTARYGNFAAVVRLDQPSLTEYLYTAPECEGNPSCPAAATHKTGPEGAGSHIVTFNQDWTTGYLSDRPGSAVTVIDLSTGLPQFVTNIPTSYAPWGWPDGIVYVWFQDGLAMSYEYSS